MTGPAIDVHRVRYHRNGVGGRGFFLVEFTSTEADVPRRLVGSVFADENDAGDVVLQEHPDGGQLVAVVDVDDLSAHWRGDVFADELVAAIQRVSRCLATYGADS